MKIIAEKLVSYLKLNGFTKEAFAKKIGVHVNEIEKMLTGKKVGYKTAEKFIRSLTAQDAQLLIDWDAVGKENPLGRNE